MRLSPTLTAADLTLIGLVDYPSNVFEQGNAKRFRDLAKRHPDLITISEPIGEFGPDDEIPYFSVRVTLAGRVNSEAHALMVRLHAMDVRMFCSTLTDNNATPNGLFWLTDRRLIASVQAVLNEHEHEGIPEPRWVEMCGEWAKRVDAVEVTRWHTTPGVDFMMELPELRDGNARRRVPLKAVTFDGALTEANVRFPLAAWWDEVLDAPKGGAE